MVLPNSGLGKSELAHLHPPPPPPPSPSKCSNLINIYLSVFRLMLLFYCIWTLRKEAVCMTMRSPGWVFINISRGTQQVLMQWKKTCVIVVLAYCNHRMCVVHPPLVGCLSTIFFNSYHARGDFCCLLITFSNSYAPSGSKPFDTLILFLKEFFEKVDFEKSQQMTTKAWKITQRADH